MSTRDRLRPTVDEAAALTEIGAYLGDLYRADYRARAAEGQLDAKGKAVSRRERKRALTAVTSSRWAGAITRKTEDQYNLAMRALVTEQTSLRQATATLEQRVSVNPGSTGGTTSRGGRKARGYRTSAERFQKTRRLAALRLRLVEVDAQFVEARPRVVHGGGRLWSVKQNFAAAGSTEEAWRKRWDSTRMFLNADGETGARFGNQTIRVDPDGFLSIKIPAGLPDLIAAHGTHLLIATPLNLTTHRATEWLNRVNHNLSVGYTVTFDVASNRWYVNAAWSYPVAEPPSVEVLAQARTLAVDVNDEFLAAYVIDPSGNPVGEPLTFTVAWKNLPASTRDAHLRHVVTRLLHTAKNNGCASVTIENLNFADARATGRETMGRGPRGKRFRRTVAGIPTGKFRNRLTAMAAEAGVFVIAVDPAYTSQWGDQHWQRPLNARRGHTKTSGPVSRHHAAALVIGRGGHGLSARRKPTTTPPTRQRTSRGLVMARSNKQKTDQTLNQVVATRTPPGTKPKRASGLENATSQPKTVRGSEQTVQSPDRTIRH